MKNKMPDTMRDYVAAQKRSLMPAMPERPHLGAFEHCLKRNWGSHQQMQTFNQRLEQIVRVSGGLILLATLLALLLARGLNHYFIRSRLVKRFTALNGPWCKLVLAERMPLSRYMDAMNWGVSQACCAILWAS